MSERSPIQVTEVVLGLGSGDAFSLAPLPTGVTVVPIAMEGVAAEDVGRAVRAVLSSRQRDPRASAKLPFVRLSLKGERSELTVADDAFQHKRMLTEARNGQSPLMLEANTKSILDDTRLEVLLAHLASVLGAASPEDIGPALAHTGERRTASEASPKEQAYARAHGRAAALARQMRLLDDRMTASVVPDWLWVASGLGGIGVLMTAVSLFYPGARAAVVPLMIVVLFLGLGAYGFRSLREIRIRGTLEDSRARLREEREAARAEAAELAETLRKKGLDPDEVLQRLEPQQGPTQLPTILFRTATSTSEVMALSDLHRQVIVFVDKSGLLAGESYNDALRTLVALERR